MRWNKRGSVVLLIVLAGALLAACGGSGGSDTSSGGSSTAAKANDKPLKIAVMPLAFDNTYAHAYFDTVKQEAARLGNVSVKLFDGKYDAGVQSAQVQDAAASGEYQGLMIQPADGVAVIPALEDAGAQGVRVVCFVSPCGRDVRSMQPQVKGQIAYIGVNAIQDGTIQADLMGKACKDKSPCEAAFLEGFANGSSDIARLDELKAGLKKYPNIKLVAVVEGKFDQAASLKVMQDVLQAHPHLNVVGSGGDQMTFGAEQAADQAGVKGIAFIGNAASKEGIEAIRQGKWYGTTVWLPQSEAKMALDTLVKNLRGQKTPSSFDIRTLSPVGPAVTPDNASEWGGQWSITGK